MSLNSRRTLTVREAAEQLGLSERNAYRLANSGELPTIKLGRRILVPVSVVERMLADPGSRDVPAPDAA